MERARTVYALISVCTKIIALCLYEVGRHIFGSVSIKVSQCTHQSANTNVGINRFFYYGANTVFFASYYFCNTLIQQDIRQLVIAAFKCFIEIVQQLGTNNTTTTPNLYYIMQWYIHI